MLWFKNSWNLKILWRLNVVTRRRTKLLEKKIWWNLLIEHVFKDLITIRNHKIHWSSSLNRLKRPPQLIIIYIRIWILH